jgi:hypothetical protein
MAAGVAALLDAGCGDCQGTYNCPAAIYGQVDVPPDLPAPITSLTADEPCSVFRMDASATTPITVAVNGTIESGTTLICQVHARLSDGTELAAAVPFRSLSGCCADLSTAIGGPTTLSPVTAKASDVTSAHADYGV